jgi:hypothetical protein
MQKIQIIKQLLILVAFGFAVIIEGLFLYAYAFGLGVIYPSADLKDALSTAVQMGRLDFISAILAIIAVALTIAALGGFWMLRSAVIEKTKETVCEELPACVEAEFKKQMPAFYAKLEALDQRLNTGNLPQQGEQIVDAFSEANFADPSQADHPR